MKIKPDTTGLTGGDRIIALAEIVKGAREGKNVQIAGRRGGWRGEDRWTAATAPDDLAYEVNELDYRLEPEPHLTAYLVVYEGSGKLSAEAVIHTELIGLKHHGIAWANRDEAEKVARLGSRVVKMVEVED